MTNVLESAGLAHRQVADIAANLPGATAVFRRHKMDFCCGGKVPLAQAAQEKGVSLPDLIGELAVLTTPGTTEANAKPSGELIDFIEARYHAVHRAELPELIRLARRVEAVHADKPSVPKGLATLLETILPELLEHMSKEEQVLFPLMRAGGHPMISAPISVMLTEHDAHGVSLRRLEALSNHFTPPADACTTWRALYSGLAKFADDLMEHIHTENNILFPRFTGAPARAAAV